jgi:hypothetical protein
MRGDLGEPDAVSTASIWQKKGRALANW